MVTTRIVELRQGVLKKNDLLATELRQRFQRAGVFVVNLVSSPGTGKTAFLQRTLRLLRDKGRPVAALVGDLETENDAKRLAESGAPVRQINTHGICHLEAEMVAKHLEPWTLSAFEFLFIENVGNLVCPSSYDLGEDIRVALLSVTEGEDKPLKYPDMFRAASLMLLNKIDLLPHVDFDVAQAVANAQRVNPRLQVLQVSARSGAGFDAWLGWLRTGLAGAAHA
jgi:hydrogenase nickel incorporation protein HypB